MSTHKVEVVQLGDIEKHPNAERVDRSVGRVSLKLVSDRYLERSK